MSGTTTQPASGVIAPSKYRFRIRTRQGWELDNLSVQGRDRAHAEQKIRQMYPHCELLEGAECRLSERTQRLFDLHHLATRGLAA